MENQVKITLIEIENSKRIKAFKAHPAENGLTVIGGRNGQGKTSVLDNIAWALGGEKYRPSQPQREGSLVPPYIQLQLSNGFIVERKGANSALKITDPQGKKGGQQILDEMIGKLALDLPKFMQGSGKDKARTLLQIIGVEQELLALDNKEAALYNQRHLLGRTADQKTKFAKEMPYYPDAPAQALSATELILNQQKILMQNAENQKLRMAKADLERQEEATRGKILMAQRELERLNTQYGEILQKLEAARSCAENLVDESTAQLEDDIQRIEEINAKVRANAEKSKADAEADAYKAQYQNMTDEIEQVRRDRIALLEGADMPLDGLTVENGELKYNGFAWDNMSSADQLRVATAIVRKINPACGFVLLDKLEQMDPDTMQGFGQWLEGEGLQAIATRVSTGSECSLIIEDGCVLGG